MQRRVQRKYRSTRANSTAIEMEKWLPSLWTGRLGPWNIFIQLCGGLNSAARSGITTDMLRHTAGRIFDCQGS